MERYDYLDNGLQIASYADGSRMIGNFTDKTIVYNGKAVNAFDFIVENETK